MNWKQENTRSVTNLTVTTKTNVRDCWQKHNEIQTFLLTFSSLEQDRDKEEIEKPYRKTQVGWTWTPKLRKTVTKISELLKVL